MIDWTSIANTFFGTLPLTIGAITGLVVALQKIEKIHKATNSMKDALVKAAGEVGHAEGVKDERARKESKISAD